MKLSLSLQKLTISTCLLATVTLSAAFSSPSASSFCHRQCDHGRRTSVQRHGQAISPRRGGTTQLHMMFDQLSAALTEVAKNFGGKQR